ncbi:hypothetical protein COO60DRAFT_1636525 [Scenedesmus sp. NREL 46B-D3]|nr:hypothetical protein COO60DRAFT_1636525 [Scenedesmus sp. NREL 46B-D3]
MAAAAVADGDDEYDSTEWPAHTQHAAPTLLQQHHQHQKQQQQQQRVSVLSAADVLRRSSSSRQQLSSSLVQGLRRASSQAASASAAATEQRRSDGGSSGSDASALDVADRRDGGGAYLRSTSASKQERHGSRTHGRSAGKGGTQLFASWQPGSPSKHTDSSILKALRPSGSRHQRQDQAAAAAPPGSPWVSVQTLKPSVVQGGGRQCRPSRALDLLQDDDSGSDA